MIAGKLGQCAQSLENQSNVIVNWQTTMIELPMQIILEGLL
jgi:hypothetical protein